MFDLTYSRRNIVRTVAVGFVLGSLVLSVGAIVIFAGLAAFGVQPFTLTKVLAEIAWGLASLIILGIALGWIVRLGLGLHAYWRYRRHPPTLTMSVPGESARQ